ncbi:MAG: CCC motif membrane protein [Bacteroidota bacterium]|nr:CCC motif membrane protein [Bacteroidota bacterium]
MDNQNKKTQNHGFEFSGEKSSKGEKAEAPEPNNGIQFETTTTGELSENPPPKAEPQTQSKKSNFMQQKLPNSGGILAMGIISIVSFCCCWGISGIVLGIIAIVMSVKAERIYIENPELFTLASYKNMRAGKITAIIGLSISVIWAIAQIIILASGANFFDINNSIQELNEIIQDPGY